MFATATIESQGAQHAAQQQTAGQMLMTAVLDQETGARGYFQTRDVRFLAPYGAGPTAFARALAQSRALGGADAPLQQSLLEQAQQDDLWLRGARAQIAALQQTGKRRPSPTPSPARRPSTASAL